MDIDQFHHDVDLYSCEVQPIETTITPNNNHSNQNSLCTTITPNNSHSNQNSFCALLAINLVYQVQHCYLNVSDIASVNNFTLLNQYQDDKSEATFICDVNVLWDDPIVACNSLSSELSSFKINSNEHREIVDKIIDCGKKRLRNSISNLGPSVLSLRANITRTHSMYRCESCMAYWAAVNLMVDEEIRNNVSNGMVPAKKSSVKKMLKRVRIVGEEEYSWKRERTRRRCVKESETCTVCLEEIGSGSGKETLGASCMPCQHVFHEYCIISWLNKSHYCPVCRFEIPV